MIKIHKLEDGDIIKILPFVDKDNNIIWYKKYTCAFINNKTIYDNSEKEYLRRISHTLYRKDGDVKLPTTIRYAYNIYINGEIQIINLGLTLYNIISTTKKEALDLLQMDNNHLYIVKEMISGFSSWGKSYFDEFEWIPPASSKEEWLEYIKSNQPDLDSFIESNNIFHHKQRIINYLGKDMLSELIVDDRQKKLELIGI